MIARMVRVVVALLLATPGVVACSDTGPCLVPMETGRAGAVVVSIEAPLGAPATVAETGACPVRIEFEGRLYDDTRATSSLYDAWGLHAGDLTLIGHATRRTVGSSGFLDDDVFAIHGIDPLDAIAMHDASPGRIFVLVKDRNRFPDALCRYLTKPPPGPSVCPSGQPRS